MSPGDFIVGNSTGSTGAGLDYFRIQTAPAPLGIYEYTIVITTAGTAGHTGTIRGLSQSGGVIGTTDNTVQTSSTSTTPARANKWYGFGKQEEIYYRVTGAAGTTADYNATLNAIPINPANLGSFQAGSITITTVGQGHTTDTDMWVYDQNLNAVPTFGNDDEFGTTSAQSRLTRNFSPGVYYLALSSFNLANNQPSPADDDFRSGSVMDFPNSAADSSSTAPQTMNFLITDSAGPRNFPATKSAFFQVLWFTFVVEPPTTVRCCHTDGNCTVVSPSACSAPGDQAGPIGSGCGGDPNGNGIDDACEDQPCEDAGPAPHWVDTAPAGVDNIPTGALVGIDTDLDCVRDQNLVMFGPAGIGRAGSSDDSNSHPGTRPVDGHLDVIDTEMMALTLTGSGATLTAGGGRGAIPLASTLGNIAEQPGDPSLADSFFDVFFEIDLGGGNRLYNQTPLRVQANGITCVPPDSMYFHPTGMCIPLYTSPIPGQGVHVANLVSARHDPFPQPGACCLPNGGCANATALQCEDQRGEFQGEGSVCAGDLNGNGIDDSCEDQPCEDAGPAPHWVDTAPAGSDGMPTGALVGIDTDLDCVRDQNLVLFGPARVRRTGSLDDSGQYPGTRPIDGHPDVIDTEMLSMSLSGGGVTLTAGAGFGAIPLAASLGNIAEQPGDPSLADSFFDVFFEVDLGGGNRLYNQAPLRVQADGITCVPPNSLYFHPIGICIPLYTSPVPGQGVHVANLVSARHDPYPLPGACCLPGGQCLVTTDVECEVQGGQFQGEGSDCGGPSGNPVVYATDPNLAIPDNVPAGVSDTMTVPDSFTVADVNVDVVINHTYLGDLIIRLTHGTTTITLWGRSCGTNENMNVIFDDEGAAVVCATPMTGTVRTTGTGAGLLSAFDGQDASGAWTLTVSDNAGVDTGTLIHWSLHLDPPEPGPCAVEACCYPDGTCAQATASDCAAAGGEPQGAGSQCLGDADGDGIDDLCADQPCSDAGPGAHWVDTAPAGNDIIPTGALVGIDTNLDCVGDQNLVLFGPVRVSRSASRDDSTNDPGTRPIDGHLDVIDTEMLSMSLTGGGVTLTAGAGQGSGGVLGQTLGNIAEQPTDPRLADSFFDVFFEVDLGGGNRVYNQTPLRVHSVIDCAPPTNIYFHPRGICIPLYTSPVPGQGVLVANLVSASHDPFPEPGACCIPDNPCTETNSVECGAQGGRFKGEGTVCTPTTCEPDQPCSTVPPGPHWVDTASAGRETIQTGALVGIDTNLDCVRDQNLVLFGPVSIRHTASRDDSNYFPGTRTVDGHLDVIDTEMETMTLTGGGVTLRAGFFEGLPLPTLGSVAELPGDPTLADSFFDVLFEVDMGGGNRLYNQTPLRVTANGITCLPPDSMYFHPTGICIPLYTSPVPGQGLHVANLVSANHDPFPQPGACCLPNGQCIQTTSVECGAQDGEFQGEGSACLGDLNGNGIDDLCEDQPCEDGGPGPHWVDTAPAGNDIIPTGALVGIDTNLDCVRDQNLVMFGPAGIRRSNPLDDSGQYPGTRPIDGHLDVIDTEMVSLSLSGGGATLIAGSGLGANPLAASLGNIAEQAGDPSLADSFFDVFFEIDLGGGSRVYNQTPLTVQAVIDCVPPNRVYFHPVGICIPLYTSPTPGQGVHVANLVSANHDPFPQPGACCLPNGNCIQTTSGECEAQGGQFQGEGSSCSPNPCAVPVEACCFADGTCANIPASQCLTSGGEPQGVGSACQGDNDGDGIDDLCADAPCSDGGPGPHWVDTTPAGNDNMPTGALVGIDTNLDCVRDQNLVMFGPAGMRRSAPLDDSGQYPGTRPIDGHLDVLDTEMLAMTLTGGGATMTAGAGRGAIPLAASLGNIAEQPGDPTLADSFFDVFFELDLGGGNRLYNQTPLRVQAVIDCVPPNRMYFHPVGICVPLYTSPTPGQGVHIANLVSANHDPFPQPGACCLPDGTCIETTSAECEAQGGQFQGEGSTCAGTTCPGCVPPGQDCWATQCGATKADFADTPIPADFFDPGSEPFDGIVLLGGGGGADTVIQRLGPLCFPDPLPSTDSVPIQLVQLNLSSCAPITVVGSGQWNVSVGLAGPQQPGTMTATKTHPNGGTFTSNFFVQPVYVFSRVGNPGDTRVFDTGLEGFPPFMMETVGAADWSTAPAFDFCSPGDGFAAGVGQDNQGQPCCEETCHGTSGDPTPCDPSAGHCHCTMPPECRSCPPGVPAANVVSAVSRRNNPRPPGFCDTNLLPPRKSEPHQGGIQEVRIGFDVPPGGGGAGWTLEEATCSAPAFVPYSGVSTGVGSIAGNSLVINFAPGLENARTYRINLGPAITSIAGQSVEVRGLVADANSDGFVNGLDRSVVVGAWTGTGFTCASDVNSSGQTNALDRSVVVGQWTNVTQNCAP